MKEIGDYLKKGVRAHLVGIGGISMRALGEVLQKRGLLVTGSDMQDSDAVHELTQLGINVTVGHKKENVEGVDLVIRTAAAHDDNPEIVYAREMGIPVFERAATWGEIMKDFSRAVCIAGTHGKTTTTSMFTHIAMEAGVDPTVMIGGYLPLLRSSYRVGAGDTIIMESCEYCNSFLNFYPTVAVILNVEEDHLDFFLNLDDIINSFHKFTELLPPDGKVVANADDKGAMAAAAGSEHETITFGFGENADVRGVNFTGGSFSEFDVVYKDSFFVHLALNVRGRHNAQNALAATAAAIVMGLPAEAVSGGLDSFRGAGRRLELKGNYNGADIYDDYAHHPTELRALLDAVEAMGYKRIICAFQPHTYSRTKALFEDFVRELRRPDITLLADIYAARESNIVGVSSEDLADRCENAEYIGALPKVVERLRELARPGDVILTVGAGDIYKVGEQLADNR